MKRRGVQSPSFLLFQTEFPYQAIPILSVHSKSQRRNRGPHAIGASHHLGSQLGRPQSGLAARNLSLTSFRDKSEARKLVHPYNGLFFLDGPVIAQSGHYMNGSSLAQNAAAEVSARHAFKNVGINFP